MQNGMGPAERTRSCQRPCDRIDRVVGYCEYDYIDLGYPARYAATPARLQSCWKSPLCPTMQPYTVTRLLERERQPCTHSTGTNDADSVHSTGCR